MTTSSKFEQSPEQTNGKTATPGTPSRRAFIGVASTLAAGSALLGRVGEAAAAPHETFGWERGWNAQNPQDLELKRHALQVRIETAKDWFQVPLAPHPTNGDEERYPNKIGTDTRGLPHAQNGEVDLTAWKVASKAIKSRSWEAIEGITLGGSRKLVNPIGTLAVSLEGENVAQVQIPPAPAIAGPERAAEAVEQYWQALLRDVAYDDFEQHPDASAAAAELSKLRGYAGPRENGVVTPRILFRGSVRYSDPRDPSGRTPKHVIPPGVLVGPHLSQFVYRDTPYGTQRIAALGRVPVSGQEFQLDYEEWLAIQNGNAATRSIAFESTLRHVRTVRELTEITHAGNPGYWAAALQLAATGLGTATTPAGIGAPVSPTNPYRTSKTQSSSNATFGVGYLQALLNTGVSRAIRAAYWSKWFVHRSVRPEAYGGLVENFIESGADYPIHDDLLASLALDRAYSKFGTYLLPQAYPEGAPIHGSYPAGSAATAGVTATLLKAFFDETHEIPNPVVPDPNDPAKLVPYTGPALTVGGELNKLALNSTFGRVQSGIHWRSDSGAGLVLGEQIAISILRDERQTLLEPFDGFTFTKFDGTKITI